MQKSTQYKSTKTVVSAYKTKHATHQYKKYKYKFARFEEIVSQDFRVQTSSIFHISYVVISLRLKE